jgi:hypothetical protein
MKRILAPAIILTGLFTALPGFAADNGGITWQQASPSMTRVYDNQTADKFDKAEPGSSNQRRLNQLLDRAVDILGGSEAGTSREKLRQLQTQITGKQKEIAQARIDMSAAPEGESGMVLELIKAMGLKVSINRADYAASIETKKAEIVQLQTDNTGAQREFADSLHKIGVNLTDTQVDGLMSTATGDDLIAMQAAFQNLKAINQELLEATISADESLEVAKRYYGLYTVLLEVAMRMHEDFIEKVDTQYLARLDKIVVDTKALQVKSVALQRSERDPSLSKALTGNVAAQDLTLFCSEKFQRNETELVIIVTPYLVQPTAAPQAPQPSASGGHLMVGKPLDPSDELPWLHKGK